MKVTFPDGTSIHALAYLERQEHKPERDFGLYFDPAWRPTWTAELIDWPDFSVPANSASAANQIYAAYQRAQADQYVEIGCLGGLGRTGTTLACMAVLAGVPATQAVVWVRKHYRPEAVEIGRQEDWVLWFANYAEEQAWMPPHQ